MRIWVAAALIALVPASGCTGGGRPVQSKPSASPVSSTESPTTPAPPDEDTVTIQGFRYPRSIGRYTLPDCPETGVIYLESGVTARHDFDSDTCEFSDPHLALGVSVLVKQSAGSGVSLRLGYDETTAGWDEIGQSRCTTVPRGVARCMRLRGPLFVSAQAYDDLSADYDGWQQPGMADVAQIADAVADAQ